MHAHTCVDPQVVLQIPSCSELLTTARLRAHKGLLSIVGPHVHLQPLQHIETFPTAFCRADEGAVISEKQTKMYEQPYLKCLLLERRVKFLLTLKADSKSQTWIY